MYTFLSRAGAGGPGFGRTGGTPGWAGAERGQVGGWLGAGCSAKAFAELRAGSGALEGLGGSCGAGCELHPGGAALPPGSRSLPRPAAAGARRLPAYQWHPQFFGLFVLLNSNIRVTELVGSRPRPPQRGSRSAPGRKLNVVFYAAPRAVPA